MPRWPVLLLPLLISACQDREARAQNAELARRVAALETEVQMLKKEQAAPGLTPPADAAAVTARAAARNCATQLARTLEDYRRGSLEKRYPAAGDIALPPPCQNQISSLATRCQADCSPGCSKNEIAVDSGRRPRGVSTSVG